MVLMTRGTVPIKYNTYNLVVCRLMLHTVPRR